MSARISWSDGLHRYALVPWSVDERGPRAEVLGPDQAMMVLRREFDGLGSNWMLRALLDREGDPSPWERVFEGLERRRWVLVRVPTESPTVHHEIPSTALAELQPASESSTLPQSTHASSTAGEDDEVATFVSFTLFDVEGRPVADWDFRLQLPDGSSIVQRTDARGTFAVDPVLVAGRCILRAASS